MVGGATGDEVVGGATGDEVVGGATGDDNSWLESLAGNMWMYYSSV